MIDNSKGRAYHFPSCELSFHTFFFVLANEVLRIWTLEGIVVILGDIAQIWH